MSTFQFEEKVKWDSSSGSEADSDGQEDENQPITKQM